VSRDVLDEIGRGAAGLVEQLTSPIGLGFLAVAVIVTAVAVWKSRS
jgi:hypothetical protein